MFEERRVEAKRNERLRGLMNTGMQIAGGVAGGAISAAVGFVIAGPVGAAIGGTAGIVASTALKAIGQELSARLLGPREEARIGYVYTLAAAEIAQRCENGENVRDDGFFNRDETGHSDAEEIWESMLLKSQREPAEKKLPYMAHLLANLAFDDQIGVDMAHQITKSAEQLTYRQLCILKLSVVKEQFDLRKDDYRGHETFTKGLYQLLYEYLGLYNMAYINFGGDVAFGPSDVKPGDTTVQALGADIFNLMRLDRIPNEDLLPIVAQLN